MAKITIVPPDGNGFEIVCGGQVIRIEPPSSSESGAAGGDADKDGGDKSAAPHGGGASPHGGGTSQPQKPKSKLPPFSPYNPWAFIRNVEGHHLLLVNAAETAEIPSRLSSATSERSHISVRRNVVNLAKRTVNIEELVQSLSDLPEDREVTVVLTANDA